MTEQDAADAEGAPETETEGDVGDDADGAQEGDTANEKSVPAFKQTLDRIDDDAGEVTDALREHVTEAETEELAAEFASLVSHVETLEDRIADHESEVEDLEDEIADLESRLARKQADFQNYKKRQEQRLEDEKARATEDLVSRLLDVRDNLQRALDQDEDVDIRDGLESTITQFDEELERENVVRIDPEPGEDVDPQRHQVLLQVESEHPPGSIADVHRPGYEMADKILREAQVSVSEAE